MATGVFVRYSDGTTDFIATEGGETDALWHELRDDPEVAEAIYVHDEEVPE